MAFTQTDLDRLKKSISKGVRRVQYQDKLVVYASMNEMLQAKRLIEEELGVKKKTSRVLAEHNKGLC